MEKTEEDWAGNLTLEGWLLEMAYAALCVSRGENVVPRYETLGVIHDVLLEENEGYVFCECVGQDGISMDKLNLFEDSIITLNSRFRDFDSEKHVVSARLVTTSDPSEWDQPQQERLEEITRKLAENSVGLRIESGKRLLYDLISRSIIGLGMIDNKIFFAGPNERAIRYDATSSKFKYGECQIDFQEFRKIPQSFLPRDYWSQRYRDVFDEAASSECEAIPEWFTWEFPSRFGISWKSQEQMKDALKEVLKKKGNQVVYENIMSFLTFRKINKTGYYTANVTYSGSHMHRNDGFMIRDELISLIRSAKAHSAMNRDHEAYLRVFTDTTTFSPDYWSTLGYSRYNGKVVYPEIVRGDEVLMDSMNYGILGLKLSGNKVTLSTHDASNVMKIEGGGLKWESGEGTYPAQLKF
ncbi:hypothetical protein IX51_03150 [uncultured archaeon]|nr:hypothetical protein IX51_03150 [uncultured archaeon]